MKYLLLLSLIVGPAATARGISMHFECSLNTTKAKFKTNVRLTAAKWRMDIAVKEGKILGKEVYKDLYAAGLFSRDYTSKDKQGTLFRLETPRGKFTLQKLGPSVYKFKAFGFTQDCTKK